MYVHHLMTTSGWRGPVYRCLDACLASYIYTEYWLNIALTKHTTTTGVAYFNRGLVLSI